MIERDNAATNAEMSGLLPTRVYPRTECQRDPVYLLQVGRWVCRNVDRYDYDSDAEELRDADGAVVDDDYMVGSEDWDMEWDTERAFFVRDEAKAWAKAREYRFNRWRTFAVSAEGDLARILGPLTTYWDGKPYPVRRARQEASAE